MPELIDRAAALEKMCDDCKSGYDGHCPHPFGMCHEYEIILTVPTIKPEVRHGRWIPIEYDSYADGAPVWDKWECSECGHEHKGEEDTLTAFCPDCGAQMDGKDINVITKDGGADND